MVWALGVVVGDEGADLLLQLAEVGSGWLVAEPAFEGLLVALDLLLGLRVVWVAVLLLDSECS